ncbi:hypothetical protein JCGZ_25969 [Jatropha curcas]|uniref:BURP domain-containing protein n=2 Tax=Jatropha curcas TaxID=180498 RepID=A0A067JH57_JATCU|nr:hypothetical protein JCGZ_25969 [Jatropha curcas]
MAMEFRVLPTLALLSVVVIGTSNAALPAEVYWHSKLPNTPIPQDLLSLLQPAMHSDTGDKSIFWDMGLADKTYDDRREKYGKRYDTTFKESVDDRREKYGKRYENAFEENIEDGREKYKRYGDPFEENTEDGREKYKRYGDPLEENTEDRREKYKRYEEKFHKHNLPSSTVFFVYNDLHAGKKMKVHITKSTNKARILPRQVADSIPFSTDKLSEIFQRFSVDPESRQGKVMKQTIVDCESPGIKGEERYCPTSLESLIDFSVKHVGNKAQVLFNQVDEPKRVQEYTIMDVKFMGENHVVCHKQKYPYAVYYCHALNGTKVYTAPLVGADATKVKAVAICHSDTSDWSPGHLAFLLLNMKPGEGTICHFIRSDTLVMLSTNENTGKN